MIVLSRPVKFEEVDAARIVFLAHFLAYAHDAMDHLFSTLEGGYPRLILVRRLGLPAVHVDMSFPAPARYGDTLRIETSTRRLGGRSAVLGYRMRRASDDVMCAEIAHTVVMTDLEAMRACDMPADVRQIFAAHLEPASG